MVGYSLWLALGRATPRLPGYVGRISERFKESSAKERRDNEGERGGNAKRSCNARGAGAFWCVHDVKAGGEGDRHKSTGLYWGGGAGEVEGRPGGAQPGPTGKEVSRQSWR